MWKFSENFPRELARQMSDVFDNSSRGKFLTECARHANLTELDLSI